MANLSAKILNSKMQLLLELIKVARPIHWIKNLALFAALIFTGKLFESTHFSKTLFAFISFNLATSAAYIFNDLLDAKEDRLHPIKRFRPIASRKLPTFFRMESIFLCVKKVVKDVGS